jgi:hypothetical protein
MRVKPVNLCKAASFDGLRMLPTYRVIYAEVYYVTEES